MFNWLRGKSQQQEPRKPSVAPPGESPASGDELRELKTRGDAHLRVGELDLALACYRQILSRDPDHPDALINLGFILRETGQTAEAAIVLARAVEVAPKDADAQYLLAGVRQAEQNPDAARELFLRAIAQRPEFEQAYRDLTLLLFQQGRFAEAVAQCEEGLRQIPLSADLHFYRSNLHLHAQEHNAAILGLKRALELKPELLAARTSLSHLLVSAGLIDAALASYLEETRLMPEDAGAQIRVGATLNILARHKEAIGHFLRAIELQPGLAVAYDGLSSAYAGAEDIAKAHEASEMAVSLAPDIAALHLALGLILQQRGMRDAALASFEKAIALEPLHAHARWARVMSHAPCYSDTPEASARERALFARTLGEFAQWWEDSQTDGTQFVGKLHPSYLTYQEQSNLALLKPYGELCARAMKRWYERQQFLCAPRAADQRIRIAFVSADIRMHSVWIAVIKGWLEKLDRTRFEVGVFCLNALQDSVTVWAKARVDFFVTGPMTLYQWVDSIRAENPAVLIYPAIGLDELSTQLASLRLAPMQVNSWGHPDTSGIPTLDYFLSAECFEPAQAQQEYSESLILLPGLGTPYEALKIPSVEPDFQKLGLDPARPILICPGAPFKYQPDHDHVFIEIARRAPNAQFAFFAYHTSDLSALLGERLRKAFTSSGMDFDRHCRFLPWQTFFEYHGLLKRSDLFLDSIGFSGYNNAAQALECGLPIVTREGRFLRGRLASGILRRVGLTELIARDEAEYVDLAVRLISDLGFSRRIREEIVLRRADLFDDIEPMKALEDVLASEHRN